MTKRAIWALVAALLILLPPATAAGQDSKAPIRGPWEISAQAGGFDDDYEFDPDGSRFFIDPDRNVIFSGFLGYHFPIGFFVGAEGRYVPLDIRPTIGGVTDLDAYFASALLGYEVNLHKRAQLFGVGGLGMALWRPETGDSENDLAFTYGLGTRLFLTDNLALIGEARMHQVTEALTQTSTDILGYAADETFWGWAFTAGFSYFFGAKDSDGDGVKDKVDECPGTPAGVTVDARGCPVDSDGDGVADYLDRCPNTPAGAQVNAEGCPVDSDGDGVFDGLDRCPNTPRGTRVDANGCPIPVAAEPEPEVRSYTFEDVYFEFDSAVLTADGQAKLRTIGATLITIPDADIEVHGHADATGEETYNMGLSLRRAEAVRDFLVQNFNQLRANQFTVRNFGESQPVADNATREGRARNRRVEIKLIGD